MESLKKLEQALTPLPRGGFLLDSPEGYIQFGAPPETIKDTMMLPQSVPQVFVLPRKLFNWKKGINLAELEFPIYYNFFLKKSKTLTLCTRDQARRLIRALQEAVFGSRSLNLRQDVQNSDPDVYLPDLKKEMAYFRGNLRFRDLLSFGFFEADRVSHGKMTILLNKNGDFEAYNGSRKLAEVPGIIEYKTTYRIGKRLPEPFQPPLFGVTCLGPSHGFDPTENTSGFIIWLNHGGIMIDPPINSTEWLQASNVNPKLIDSIILTHCHADHDAGTLQKILEEGKITIYTTQTVLQSFLKKYSSITGEPESYLRRLFHFNPIYIGKPAYIHGGEFRFFYALHSIPTVGFTLTFQDRSFVYSSDHQADPVIRRRLNAEGIIDKQRMADLRNFPWHSKVIYHESGIPPLHTPITYLDSLPKKLQKRIVVYHIARKDFPKRTDLRLATFGIENTLYFRTRAPVYEKPYQILRVLKHLDFFDSLSVEKAMEFVSIVEERVFRKGEIVLHRGRPGNHFYIITSGNVSIQHEELIDRKILGTYEYFGEIALLTEAVRTADVVAETDVTVFIISKEKFLAFITGTEFEKTLHRLLRNRSPETWNLLASSPFSQCFTSYQKTWLESILVPLELQGSGTLLEQGKPVEKIAIIRRGEAEVMKGGGKVAALGPGDFIGAFSKIHRNELSDYTVTYPGPLSVYTITKDDVLEFVERNPGLALKLDYEFYLPESPPAQEMS